MNAIDEVTYNIVKDLQAKRAEGKIEPVNVSLIDILREMNARVKASLNGFVENETMTWYPNLNGNPMFKIQKPID